MVSLHYAVYSNGFDVNVITTASAASNANNIIIIISVS